MNLQKDSCFIYDGAFVRVDVFTNNGKVTLEGYVRNSNDLDKIEKEIRNIAEVKARLFNFEVRQQSTLSYNH